MNSSLSPSPRHAKQALKWILRQGSGEFDDRDRRRLSDWLEADPRHRSAYERQQAFWQTVDQARSQVLAALPELVAEAAKPVEARISPWHGWRGPALALAAALVLAILLAPQVWLPVRGELRSGIQPQTFELDDGSKVVLDADSVVALDFSSHRRQLELLRGRAWFKVAHEARPFHVRALGGDVRDIGTAFAVDVDADLVTTAVSEGRVEVTAIAGSKERLKLGQGQRVRYRRGGALLSQPQSVMLDQVAPWRQGEILLDAVPAKEAIARIANYRRAPAWVLGTPVAAESITGTFHTSTPDEAIHAVADQAGLKVRSLPGGVLLLTSR